MAIRIFLLLFVFLTACSTYKHAKIGQPLAFNEPPAWAREAVWYQIFIERFRNGNTNNDPTRKTCAGALFDPVPEDWTLTPWGHNWYAQEDWAQKTGLDFYRTIQMRRYGGDLDGVSQKISYLKKLGINAIYFNPLNDAPSLHKYDARNYHHIDVTLGDDPERDMSLMATENPADAKTWVWTTADQKFIELIKKLHAENIKVVLDFSWNHTGTNFWAFQDVLKNMDKSVYKDWYEAHFQQDEKTKEVQISYEGWIGIKSLPELRKINTKGKIAGHPYEGNLHPAVKQHIFDVCKRWMDPNGDGKFDDGIDGMRLDVAEHVPLGFWRDFRTFVRSINPDFYLVGENWWTRWPDVLMDPGPWVKGDVFDAVMHYQWYKVARDYFAMPSDVNATLRFKNGLDSLFLKYPDYTRQAMMNLSASHDAPRLLTCFANPSKYKFDAVPRDNPMYNTQKPSPEVYDRVRLFLLHQFTFTGSPHIWNGDEMGMTGADDPDCRKPLFWPDIPFENETQSVSSKRKYNEIQSFDQSLFDYYASLIQLRKSSKAFSLGDYKFEEWNGNNDVLGYYRFLKNEKYLIMINVNPDRRVITWPYVNQKMKLIFHVGDVQTEGKNKVNLSAFSGAVYKLK